MSEIEGVKMKCAFCAFCDDEGLKIAIDGDWAVYLLCPSCLLSFEKAFEAQNSLLEKVKRVKNEKTTF